MLLIPHWTSQEDLSSIDNSCQIDLFSKIKFASLGNKSGTFFKLKLLSEEKSKHLLVQGSQRINVPTE
jgi:hypothetical protein